MINGLTAEDTNLATMITRAEHALAAYCRFPPASATAGPTLEEATYTLYLDGPSVLDAAELLLPIRPVKSITSVHDDPNLGHGSSFEVASTEWRLDKQRGTIRILPTASHVWNSAPETIKVIGVFGLTTGAIPEFVKHACILTVKELWSQRGKLGFEASAMAGKSATYVPPVAIPVEAKQLIAPLVMWERAFSGAQVVGYG